MNTALKVVLGIFVLGIVYIAYLFSTGNLAMPTPNDSENVSGKLMINGENVIAATEQKPGNEVFVNFVLVKDAGFVVVHEINADGSAGKVIGGSALLPAGQSSGVTITVSKEMKDGEKYIAMIHKDNGDGVREESNDPAVLDDKGNVVQALFGISADANPVNVQL